MARYGCCEKVHAPFLGSEVLIKKCYNCSIILLSPLINKTINEKTFFISYFFRSRCFFLWTEARAGKDRFFGSIA